MKNYLKFFALVTLFVTIGLLTVSCGDEGNSHNVLSGVWEGDGIVVTIFKESYGEFTQIYSGGWAQAKNRGYVRTGDQKFRNIKPSGDLKWSGQLLSYNPSTYATSWYNCTFTIHSNGQLQTYAPGTGNIYVTYTRK